MWESPKALVRHSIVNDSFYMFYTTELALYTPGNQYKMGLFSCHTMHSGNRIGDKKGLLETLKAYKLVLFNKHILIVLS